MCNFTGCQCAATIKGKCRKHYHLEKTREWRKANPDRARSLGRVSDSKRRLTQERREYVRAKLTEYLSTPNGRAGRLETLRRYAAKRYRAELAATPTWVNRSELERIYQSCPPGFEVDHIVPILGKDVCGLHVPHNLQYLTASENARKGNRYEDG